MSLAAAFDHLVDTLPTDSGLVGWLDSYFNGATLGVFAGNDAGQVNDGEMPAVFIGDPVATPATAGETFCAGNWQIDIPLRFVWKNDDRAEGHAALLALVDVIPVVIGRNETMGGAVERATLVRIERDAFEHPKWIVRAELRLIYEIDEG